MKLKIKEEYKEWSISGSRVGTTKFKNLDPTLYEQYFLSGWSEFFEEVKGQKAEQKKEILNNKDIENDINK